jgi:hypothetical protein
MLSTAGTGPAGGADQGGAGGATSGAGAGAGGGVTSGAGGTAPEAWWDASFAKRTRITFKNNPGEALDGFPVMVRLDAARIDYAAASAGGEDLRFVDDDGSTVLPHEIDRWTPGGESFVWVRVPRIDADSSADRIWLYYGNRDATDAEDPAAVWAGFAGVYHLSPNQADETLVSDSAGGHDGAWDGGNQAETIAGVIGDAAELDGTQFADMGNVSEFDADPGEARTIEIWFNPSVQKEQFIVYHEDSCMGWFVGMTQAGEYFGRLSTDAGGNPCDGFIQYPLTPGGASTGAWHYLVLVVDRPNSQMGLFADGAFLNSRQIDNSNTSHGAFFYIGANYNWTKLFEGLVDEVRISSSSRSPGWIAAQFKSMKGDFLVFDAL